MDWSSVDDVIVPVTIPQRRGDPVIFKQDEYPRSGTTMEKLAALKAPFRDGGTGTAGNASGINDGAAAVLIASEDSANIHGINPINDNYCSWCFGNKLQ